MKRFLFAILLPTLIISCKTTINKIDIYGAWRSIPETKWQTGGISDSIIFAKSLEFKTYILENNSIVNSTFGKFYIDASDKILTTEFQSIKTQFEIIELSSKSLVTRQTGKKVLVKYRKLD